MSDLRLTNNQDDWMSYALKLEAALKDCADELADQIEGYYAATKDHPTMKRRYDRDMTAVLAARNLLKR